MSSHTHMAQDLEPHALPAGTRIGPHLVVRGLLGRGGTASVYEALHLELARPVAVKVCEPGAGYQGEARARLLREAAACAQIDDARLPRIHAVDELEDGTPYLVMEIVRGRTLRAVLDEQGEFSVDDACRLVVELLDVLGHVHARGILHRDIKPSNLIVEQQPGKAPRLCLIDFGICRQLDGSTDGTSITRCGEIVGTPTYMAPEQLTGMPLDARVDVYAAGALLFELLTGLPPHGRLSYGELIAAVLRDEPPSVREFRPEVPVEVAAVVARAIEKSPRDRFASVEDMRCALEAAVRSAQADRAPARPRHRRRQLENADTAIVLAPHASSASPRHPRVPRLVPQGCLRTAIRRLAGTIPGSMVSRSWRA